MHHSACSIPTTRHAGTAQFDSSISLTLMCPWRPGQPLPESALQQKSEKGGSLGVDGPVTLNLPDPTSAGDVAAAAAGEEGFTEVQGEDLGGGTGDAQVEATEAQGRAGEEPGSPGREGLREGVTEVGQPAGISGSAAGDAGKQGGRGSGRGRGGKHRARGVAANKSSYSGVAGGGISKRDAGAMESMDGVVVADGCVQGCAS